MARKIAGSDKRAKDGQQCWELQLYVAGNNIRCENALTEIKKICYAYLNRNCHIEVIDLKKRPELAFKEHIVALPTLVRTSPGPRKILVGDLTDEEKVLNTLEIKRLNGS